MKFTSELNAILSDREQIEVIAEDEDEGAIPKSEYEYLLTMPIFSLSKEKIDELIRLMKEKKRERQILEAKHIHEIWNEELD